MKVFHKWESVLVTHRLRKNSNCDTTVHFHMSKLYFILKPLTTKIFFFNNRNFLVKLIITMKELLQLN